MPSKKAATHGSRIREAKTGWTWSKRYRVWDANRKIFQYPENWIEPEQRTSPKSNAALRKMLAYTRYHPRRKGVRIVLAGKNQTGALVAAQTLARNLGKDLYRIDLSAVVAKYVGDTEKNLRSVFDAVKTRDAVLFFDEADALFGKRTGVKDSHDRYANPEIDYLLQRIEEYRGVSILATKRRANVDDAFLRRLRFVVSILPRRKARQGTT